MDKKFIVITGASSGFGAEMAKLFAKDGHNLLLLARRTKMMEELNIPNALIKKVDVTNFEEFNNAVKEGIAKFGPVDMLVNNAGVMYLGQMGTQPREQYSKMIDVNVKGAINGIETVVEDMKQRGQGTIVNIDSVAGLRPSANHVIYTTTKFAVRGLSENLRMEVAPFGVRVANVNPGVFDTELIGHTTNPEIIKGYESWKHGMSTNGKVAQPIEVAKAVKYIFDAPAEVNIAEITLYPTKQGN